MVKLFCNPISTYASSYEINSILNGLSCRLISSLRGSKMQQDCQFVYLARFLCSGGHHRSAPKPALCKPSQAPEICGLSHRGKRPRPSVCSMHQVPKAWFPVCIWQKMWRVQRCWHTRQIQVCAIPFLVHQTFLAIQIRCGCQKPPLMLGAAHTLAAAQH